MYKQTGIKLIAVNQFPAVLKMASASSPLLLAAAVCNSWFIFLQAIVPVQCNFFEALLVTIGPRHFTEVTITK